MANNEAKPVLAWHWVGEDRLLKDGQAVIAGKTYAIEGKPVMCERGLHASERAIDALHYAPGPIICRVQLGGVILRGDDKLVATERTVLWVADATNTLHEFGCWSAEQALDLVEARGWHVAEASRAAIDAKRRWLSGELDTEGLRQAEAAAAAAEAAAEAAAWAAARAAEAAAWAAARAAEAAWAAARAAARAAEAAAWAAAAEAAAWAAARARQNDQLTAMLAALGAPMPQKVRSGG